VNWQIPIDDLVEMIASEVVKRVQTRPREPRLLSVEDTAFYLGRTPEAVRMMIRRGTLPAIRIDGRIMLDVLDLNKIIEASREIT
jgi:hypothetical protein